MKKIIHIASDEKFINSAYWQFNEVFPGHNTFYILVNDINKSLNHVNICEDFILKDVRRQTLRNLAKEIGSNNIVVFHGLNYESSLIAIYLKPTNTIVWFLWGVEFYHNTRLIKQSKLYGQDTTNIFFSSSRFNFIENFIKNCFRESYYKIVYHTDSHHKTMLKAMRRAQFCGILYEEEFNLIKNKIKKDINFLKFSYYPIELMIKNVDSKINDNNILIGNSASFSNNHLEIFKKLERINLGNRKLIVPLSYGNKLYGNKIIEIGKSIFSENFIPLEKFITLHEYNNYLKGCGIVIMNHYRQQAVGNVLTMLWMGAKVYLDERNSLIHFLRRIGIYVYSIQQDLIPTNKKAFELLDLNQQIHNRKHLKEIISKDFLLKDLKEQFQQML